MRLKYFLLVLLTSIGYAEEIVGRQEWFFTDVKRVFSALEKVVSFYEQNGDTLNLDAYFGLRIAQG